MLSCPFLPCDTWHVTPDVCSMCCAHNCGLTTWECTCWRQFVVQWGDCKHLELRLSIQYYYYYYCYYYHAWTCVMRLVRVAVDTAFLQSHAGRESLNCWTCYMSMCITNMWNYVVMHVQLSSSAKTFILNITWKLCNQILTFLHCSVDLCFFVDHV